MQPSETIYLIANPAADRGFARKSLPDIEHALNRLNLPFTLQTTTAPGHGIELARTAAQAGYKQIVAVGGDGTCNEVVTGLLQAAAAGDQAVMGIIPLGSGNDLAFALNIPVEIEAACARLLEARQRRIDVGQVVVDGERRFFANNVGLGLDAEVNIRALRVKLLSGFSKYLWAVFQVIAFGRWPYCLQVSLFEPSDCRPTTLVTIANGVRAGGGFLLTPEASLDDGLFDICYARAMSRLQLLDLLPKTLKGSHTGHPAVTMATGETILISTRGGVPAHIDGEVLCLAGKEFEFQIMPKALSVLV
jgi:YegS/Rv2252/BmrU family lipid kinase